MHGEMGPEGHERAHLDPKGGGGQGLAGFLGMDEAARRQQRELLTARVLEILKREGVDSLADFTMDGLCLVYEEIHGQSISSQALYHRMKRHNIGRMEALLMPRSPQGRRPQQGGENRHQGRSGRPRLGSSYPPPCPIGYVYLHLDVRLTAAPVVRFVGYGRGSAFSDTSGILCDHESAHLEWLNRWVDTGARLSGGLLLSAIENPAALTKMAESFATADRPEQLILVTKPQSNPESIARTLYLFYLRSGHDLFRDAGYWAGRRKPAPRLDS